MTKLRLKNITTHDSIFYGIRMEGDKMRLSLGLRIGSHGEIFEGITNLRNNWGFGRFNDGSTFSEGFYRLKDNRYMSLNNDSLKNKEIMSNDIEGSNVESTI